MIGVCALLGCGRQHEAKGLCAPHYRQALRGLPLHPVDPRQAQGPVCSFSGCDRSSRAKGLCVAHYSQQHSGRPLGPIRHRRPRPEVSVPDGSKYCLECEAALPLSDFHRVRNGPQGRKSNCKQCDEALRLESQYNLPRDNYRTLLATQGGVCAICKSPCSSGVALAVDHDHACCPGKRSCGRCIRGLLCRGCNQSLGKMKDSVDLLESAIRYLTKGALPHE